MGHVTSLQRVHLRTPRIEDSVAFYTKGFGLTLLSDDGQTARFSGARSGVEVLRVTKGAPGLAGLAFTIPAEEMNAALDEFSAKGLAPVAAEEGFTVLSPDGHAFDFVVDQGAPDATATDGGLPLFVSHVVMNSLDAPRLTSFFVDDLGFVVADRYERDLLTFLKARQPQHHCIGVSPGEASTLNHFSLDVGSIDALMRSVGRMKKAGFEPVWGPGRHGPGGNVFCYFEDPTGFVAEFTCDVLQIEDDSTWVPKEWPRVPDTANVWGTGGPSPRAVGLMAGRHEA